MLGLLVVTHGRLAEELVQAAHTIVGDRDAMRALSIGWDVAVGEAGKSIEQAIPDLDRGAGVLVLTDMFGGTPTNLALTLHEQGKIEIVTGVNLPMVIKFTNLAGNVSLADAARLVAEQGRDAIQVASHLLDASGAADGGADD